MSNRGEIFDEAEGFRTAHEPAMAVIKFDEHLVTDPMDPVALHMRGVAFGMVRTAEDRYMLAHHGYSGSMPAHMLDSLSEARRLFERDGETDRVAHVDRDIGKAHYLAGHRKLARHALDKSVEMFDALNQPAERAMSQIFLGRVSVLDWTEYMSDQILARAQKHIEPADAELRELGRGDYELFGKPTFVFVLAVQGKRKEAEAQLARGRELLDEHGNPAQATALDRVGQLNRFERVVPAFVERYFARKMLLG